MLTSQEKVSVSAEIPPQKRVPCVVSHVPLSLGIAVYRTHEATLRL